MNGDDIQSKSDLELLIHQNGGSKVQYPTSYTHYIIAGRLGISSQPINFQSTISIDSPITLSICPFLIFHFILAIKVQNLIQSGENDIIHYK